MSERDRRVQELTCWVNNHGDRGVDKIKFATAFVKTFHQLCFPPNGI